MVDTTSLAGIEAASTPSYVNTTTLGGVEAASASSLLNTPQYGSSGSAQASNVRKEQFKVRVTCGNDIVIFEASAPVNESRSANYEGYSIVHLPTDIWAYRNTTSRKFSISGKLAIRLSSKINLSSRSIFFL